ncbi:MAG: hypothetical protein GWN93_06220 [Deltaproteobacteria bacterium]|nr:hypothetical protein [Deltaproteobacteria bacterium]
MAIRFAILTLFLACGMVSLLASVKGSGPARAMLFWCVNVIAFTAVTILRALGVMEVDVHALNVWSGIVRMHGGLTILVLSIYFYVRRFP